MSSPSAKPQGRQRPSTNGYEKRDANAKWIFAVIAFLLVAGLLMHLCLAGVVERLEKKPTSSDQLAAIRRSSENLDERKAVPHLQITPAEDLKQFRMHKEAELNSYGWIDRTAGVVRIPVARAMDLLLERGLPTRSQTNESGLGPSGYELQQQRPQFPQPEIQGAK
ncbi:MAG TPA: hypothetical protein VH597_03455 [Verrucomicrobiae bacterium]|jgi:hypothetical protein|nr:hypothetical protein [Verrucomicrobiae bacterium]